MQHMSAREGLINRITNRIRQSLELQEILTTAVSEMRLFLHTDRVKIYRFNPDGSGEVIAEAIADDRLPSLLGLNFPASDIPPLAREMFVKSRQRVIVDVTAQQRTLSQLDCPYTGENLAVEDIRHAPADPCHLEYLSNMGVYASLVVPILHQKQLWGLFVAHHAETRAFSEDELQIVQLLVDQVSIAIAQSNLLNQARKLAHHEATLNRISSLLHSPLNVANIRQRVLEETVTALNASGGRLYINADPLNQPAQIYSCGEQPDGPAIEESLGWYQLLNLSLMDADSHSAWDDVKVWHVATRSPLQPDLDLVTRLSSTPKICSITDLYAEPHFQSLVPAFQETAIRSVLIVPLQYQQQYVGYLSVFRNEVETETLWAGRLNSDDRNLRPRASFEAWRETRQGQAQEWAPDEIKLAHALGIHLYMAVMQRRVEEMIRHQASHDLLTGLPNRLLLNERLALALVNAHRYHELLAVMFVDLDRFKTINDTLGHAVGDQLLQNVTDRLKHCLRETDFIARWGGDEFTILLPQLNHIDEATAAAQKILEVLNEPFWFDQREFYVSASIGIALAPRDGEDAETLLKNADTAMYRAKQQGKNDYQLYAPMMNGTALEELVLENHLRKALDRGEFVLYYQPQLDLQTGRLIAMEALIRWQHPQLGLVPPYQFIPIAEENGLICPIGEWVLRTACAQNRLWQEAGLPPIRVAVNLSGRQFQQQNLVRTIAQILQETSLDPHYLEIEITESVAVQNIEFTISVLEELQRMGIHVSIDDFGTGYSSLSCLKRFPLNTLKIDRSFIRDLALNSNDAAIAKAIVSLGQGLNLRVIAEGVENQEQLAFLCSIGCDGVQGYFFSKPVPTDLATQYCSYHHRQVSCPTIGTA